MTRDGLTWVVAVWQVGTAIGIAVFWFTWFRQPHDQEWLPVGYVEHERAFVFSDSALALLLVASAALLVAEESLGRSLALVCAGMLIFLGVMDLAYFGRHGMFAREHEGLVNGGLVAALLGLAVVLVARYA